MIVDSTNKQGDKIEIHSDGVVLNHSYWECDCDHSWIRAMSKSKCDDCGAYESDCANAREQEVQQFIYH